MVFFCAHSHEKDAGMKCKGYFKIVRHCPAYAGENIKITPGAINGKGP